MTLIQILTILMAAVSCWWIWNREDIFSSIRRWMMMTPWLKFAWCETCNPFWITLVSIITGYLFWDFTPVRVLFGALACYPIVRLIPWLERSSMVVLRSMAQRGPSQAPAASRATSPPATSKPVEPTEGPGCSKCEQKRSHHKAENERVLAFKERVAILTALGDFRPGYSLVTVILSQARMLAERYPERLVVVFVQRGCDMTTLPKDLPSNVEIRAEIPPTSRRPDDVQDESVTRIARDLTASLIRLGNATIITHDLLFQASFTNHAAAIHQIHDLPGFAWIHIAHSCAGSRRPPAEIAKYRASLPPGHRLAALTRSEIPYLAAYYATTPDRIILLPNARDLSDFMSASPWVRTMVHDHALDSVDIVQVYPLSATRMQAKGVPMVIKVFAALHRLGHQVRLVIAMAHANGDAVKHEVQSLRADAVASGLPPECLIFSAETYPQTATYGLPKEDIALLMSFSNVFVFPSIAEACPLVLAEAALAGCLIVTNSSVPNMQEVVGHAASLTFAFGGERETGPGVDANDVAVAIIGALDNPQNRAKRQVLRQRSNNVVSVSLERALASAVRASRT